MRPAVSVVVVTWNSAGVVDGCLQSLPAAMAGRTFEVTVVDNGSGDGTVDRVRKTSPDARVVANGTNRGLPAANNQGLLLSAGSYVLVCNPDVVFAPGAVDAMVSLMERQPGAGWVVPRLVYEDGALQTSAGDLPSLWDTVLGRQASRRREAGVTSGFWWDKWDHDEERPIGRGHEAAYLVRREAVASVGLQDERYVLDWEGIDWTDRFRAAGWEVWLCPAAEVVHLGGNSIRQVPFRWVVSQHRGMYRYFADRRRRVWRPVLAATFALRAAVKIAGIRAGVPLYQRAHRDHRSDPTQATPS